MSEKDKAREWNPWLSQVALFAATVERMKLPAGLATLLREPMREIIVHIPVVMDSGEIQMFTGYRVQHSIARGPGKAASATRRTSRWTKCARWPAG